MLEEVAGQVQQLITAGTPGGEIAILAPFVSSSSGFAMQQVLSRRGIRTRILRPSIPLIEDPVIQCFITLAQIIHSEWKMPLAKTRLVNSLTIAIAGLDLVRAQLIADNLLDVTIAGQLFKPYTSLPDAMQARITPELGSRYEEIRLWLNRIDAQLPLDIFVSRLFGEVLSQPGFGLFQNISAGQSANNLMESSENSVSR